MSRKMSVESVNEALSNVKDPEIKRDLRSLGMIGDVRIDGTRLDLTIELTSPACPKKRELKARIEEALAPLGFESVDINWGHMVRTTVSQQISEGAEPILEAVKNVVLVASGKGGVGKSTVSANLALALAMDGAKVGLLDADIYGPSIPIMFGAEGRPTSPDGKRITPLRVHGIDLMSIGFFVQPDAAMVWRGPILNGTVTQFIRDVAWGELDYLIVDLPPGTGDIQLSISQQMRVTGAVLVTTPQDVALADVVRGKTMFDQVKIPTLGVVENMSYFICDNCDKRHDIFSSGGGETAATELSVPFLGALPLVTAVREASDQGHPIVSLDKDSPASEAFRALARTLACQISTRAVGAGTGKRKIFSKIFA